MTVLCHPRCSTCAKALKWLDERKIPYEWRDIQKQNPTQAELAEWHAQSGLALKRFFNTSGMAYRQQELKDKLPSMDEAAQLQLLATDGMLVKRPLVVHHGRVLVGFRPAEWQAFFGGG